MFSKKEQALQRIKCNPKKLKKKWKFWQLAKFLEFSNPQN